MNRSLLFALSTTILTGILGLWVILQPFLIQYQAVGSTFLEGTRNDVWVGAGLIALSLVTTLGIVGEAAYEDGLDPLSRTRPVPGHLLRLRTCTPSATTSSESHDKAILQRGHAVMKGDHYGR